MPKVHQGREMSYDILNSTAQDAAIAKVATTASISGGVTAVLGGLNLNEWAMCIGIIVGVLGFIVQLIVQTHLWAGRRRAEKRAAIIFRARMKKLKDSSDPAGTDFDEL